MNNNYFKWVSKEASICKIFQQYIEEKRGCKTFLKTRENKQAPIDFLWRFYHSSNNNTICEVAVEVRTLIYSKEHINNWLWYIMFPIAKLNELMMFWRMKKEIYIVYQLKDKVYFLEWNYYLNHNFELWTNKLWNFIKLPIKNFIECW